METLSLRKIDIRMYYTGFGDCFLLTFYYQGSDEPLVQKNVWIDFGSRAGSKETMQDVARDLCARLPKTNDGKAHVDVLVITHEHEDHISGFSQAQAKDILDELSIGQLWFAWTEQPDYPLAQEWRSYQNRSRLTLGAAYRAMHQRLGARHLQVKRLKNLFGFDLGTDQVEDLVDQAVALTDQEKNVKQENAEEDEKAKPDKSTTTLGQEVYGFLNNKTLKSKGSIEYKHPGQVIENMFPGVRIYVLGPPEDMNYVRKDQSSRPGELYMQASYTSEDYSLSRSLDVQYDEKTVDLCDLTATDPAVVNDFWHYVRKAPFDEEFVLPMPPKGTKPADIVPKNYQTPVSEQYVAQYERLEKSCVYKGYFEPEDDWRRIDNDYLMAADNLAMRLNSSTNNTSLVLAFEIVETGEVLLFPGDAQYGVWLAWQDDWEKTQKTATSQKSKTTKTKYEENYARKFQWTVSEHDDPKQKKTVTVEDLLNRTVVYKVGHHGSHNATPQRTGLEKLISNDLLALIPVDQRKAESFDWDEIPYLNLLEALKKRNAVCYRSDQLNDFEQPKLEAGTQWKMTYQIEKSKSQCFVCTLEPR
ncbi:hypothetical protein GCM10028819_49660 [Spirosoma humi]